MAFRESRRLSPRSVLDVARGYGAMPVRVTCASQDPGFVPTLGAPREYPSSVKTRQLAHALLLGICLLSLQTASRAQVEDHTPAYSQLHSLTERVPSKTLQGTTGQAGLPLSMARDGVWTPLPGGGRLWRLRIQMPGARDLALGFRIFCMPPGAGLHVIDDATGIAHGQFQACQQNARGGLELHPIEGSSLTLEYFEPSSVLLPGALVLDRVVARLGPQLKSQGPQKRGTPAVCQVDVSCDAGRPWQALTRSIVKIEGVQNCTGVLINNTSGDGTPFILTAKHCGSLRLANFWFHWKRDACGQALQPGVKKFKSIFGSELVVESRLFDFQLIRLSSTPGPEFELHYAGWDASEGIPENVTTLHHPWGDVMKISQEFQPPLLQKNNWKIRSWDLGITESGSSGAPLFNPEQRIVGQLKGGPATCRKPRGDIFGRLASEWELLAPYLDPLDSGSLTCPGMDPAQALFALGIVGLQKDSLATTEEAAILRGMGFKGRLKVFIDDTRLPGKSVRWLSNSKLQLGWKDLEPGTHELRIQEGEVAHRCSFQVLESAGS